MEKSDGPVPFYTPSVFAEFDKMPRFGKLPLFTRIALFLIPSRLIGYDTDGIHETIVWGKRWRGVTYITGMDWSETK